MDQAKSKPSTAAQKNTALKATKRNELLKYHHKPIG